MKGDINIVSKLDASADELLEMSKKKIKVDTLEQYFDRGEELEELTYCEYFEQYNVLAVGKGGAKHTEAWHKDRRGRWVHKRASTNDTVARIPHFSVTQDRETWHLRLILLHRAGTSYKDLRTVDGKKYNTYAEAARACGLLFDNDEHLTCMREASADVTPAGLRCLLVTLIMNGAEGRRLWTKCKQKLIQDFTMPGQRPHCNQTEEEAVQLALKHINHMLKRHGRTCIMVGLPKPADVRSEVQEARDELHNNHAHHETEAAALMANASEEQRRFIDHVQHALKYPGSNGLFYLDGPGGYGKTFVLQALLHSVWTSGRIAVAVASSGIAATGLPSGHTAHSMFRIPLEVFPATDLNIPPKSERAELLRNVELVVWDEISMASLAASHPSCGRQAASATQRQQTLWRCSHGFLRRLPADGAYCKGREH